MKLENNITFENLDEVIAERIANENGTVTFYANMLYGSPGHEDDADRLSRKTRQDYELGYAVHIELRNLLQGYQEILKVHELVNHAKSTKFSDEKGQAITIIHKCANCGYKQCFTREIIQSRLAGIAWTRQ